MVRPLSVELEDALITAEKVGNRRCEANGSGHSSSRFRPSLDSSADEGRDFDEDLCPLARGFRRLMRSGSVDQFAAAVDSVADGSSRGNIATAHRMSSAAEASTRNSVSKPQES